jgi:hypothetical protein
MKVDSHTILGTAVLFVAAALVMFGKLSGDQWVTIAQVIVVTLVGGNAITHTVTQLTQPKIPTATLQNPPTT